MSSVMIRFLFLCLLVIASPAAAERLQFDHRLYPPLKDVLAAGNKEMTAFDNSDPKYVVDRIAIQGRSAQQWTEAIDIVARVPAKGVTTADDWFAEIKKKAEKVCSSRFTELARDTNSITFSRQSSNCGTDKVQTALYRIVTGNRNLFLLNAIYRGEMAPGQRAQWLELLASARLEQ
jgi:hypothetical protein